MTRPVLRTIAAAALVCGSLSVPRLAEGAIRVVATVPDLAALAREVGGSRVSVTSLALPTQDPHFVDARPNLALELSRADLLLLVGVELEIGWLPNLLVGSRNGRVQRGARGYLDCSTLVSLREIPRQRIDRSMGDIHPQGNPHYLFDPRGGAAVARGVADRLAEIDPAGARQYRDNLRAFLARLDQARQGWERRLARLRGAKVIGFHDSWPYFAEWLGLDVVDHIEPRPGIPPNPGHVARVLAHVRRDHVRLVLQEEYYPDTTARLIEQRSGAKLVRIPGGADVRQGETYIRNLEEVAGRLERALSGS